MKVLSFMSMSGGDGKTELTYCFGKYLINKGYRVLFVDFGNLPDLAITVLTNDSAEFKEKMSKKKVPTISDIDHELEKAHDVLKPYKISDKIGLLHVWNMNENELRRRFVLYNTSKDKDEILYNWVHSVDLEKNYDYVLFDTPERFYLNFFTQASDAIFRLVSDSHYSYSHFLRLKSLVTENEDNSFITGKKIIPSYLIINHVNDVQTKTNLRDDLEKTGNSVLTEFPYNESMDQIYLGKEPTGDKEELDKRFDKILKVAAQADTKQIVF